MLEFKRTLDIIGKKKIYFIISGSLIFITILFSFIFGVELDIQFKGGTMMTYEYVGDLSLSDFENAAETIAGTNVNATLGSSFTDGKDTIKINFTSNKGVTADVQVEITKYLQEEFSENQITLFESSDINPASGKEFLLKCMVAILISFILLIVYVAFRFRKIGGWSAGVMSIIALLHDVFMVFATFVIFQIPLNANFMAVVLTILGYSLNDTIVIYDRIRENRKLLGNKVSNTELVNISVTQSLRRSIYTSVTTIITMLIVTIVALIFGVTSIVSFSFPLIIGMITGAYSSICIAGTLWVMWHNYKSKRGPKKPVKTAKAKTKTA